MAKRLLIIGSGGHAKEIAQIARRIDPERSLWNPISYVADSLAGIGQNRPYGTIDYIDDDVLSGVVAGDVVIGLGDSHARYRVVSRLVGLPNLSFPNLVDPSVAIDEEFVVLGKGNVFHRQVVLTCDIVIGDFNVFNKGSIVAHDAHVGSFNDVHPAASLHGYSQVGDGCIIGAGARVLPNVSVADRTTIGAGAILLHSIPEPGHVYAGVPAKRLR